MVVLPVIELKADRDLNVVATNNIRESATYEHKQ